MSELEGSWHPDPFGRHEYRWFDGGAWSDQVSDGGVVTTDPPVPGVAATSVTPVAPAAVPAAAGSNTVPLVLGAVAVVALVAAGLIVLLGGDDGGSSTAAPDPSTTVAVETTTTTVDDAPDPAVRLLLSRLLDDADLTDTERRCFSDGFLEAFGADLAPLLAGAQGPNADPRVELEVTAVLDRCGLSPSDFGGVASGFPGLGGGTTVIGPNDYGDDPYFDALWDACDAGDGVACDDLYLQTPIDSVYEEFGATCGYRYGFLEVRCETALGGSSDRPNDYGDDPYLDTLWDDCDAGDGVACDDLYWETPIGSVYEEFGATCGGRFGFLEVQCADALD